MHRPRGLLLLIVWCWLVQISLVEARPDLGVPGPVNSVGILDDTTELLFTQFQELTTWLDIQLGSQSSELRALIVPLQALADAFGTAGQTFATTLWTAIDSQSNLDATYQPVITALNKLQMMRENILQETLDSLELIHATALVAQLTEVFRRTNLTINNITGALLQLISSLTMVHSGAEVPLSLVNLLNSSIRKLVADVVLLNYTIRSVAEEIIVADRFLSQLSYAVGNATAATTLALQRFTAKMNRCSNAVGSDASCLLKRYKGFEDTVRCTLGYLNNTGSSECALESTCETFVDVVTSDFHRAVCAIQRDYESLGNRTDLSQLLQNGYADILELGNLLAQSTTANGPYAVLCQTTYASRIVELPNRLSDGVVLCLKNESKRLDSLHNALNELLPTVLYDVEELVPSLEVCIRQPTDEQDACICELNDLLEELASRTTTKLELIERFTYHETHASEERLKACVLQSTTTVLGQQLVRLRNEIRQCATSGPNCSQYVDVRVDCETHPVQPDDEYEE